MQDVLISLDLDLASGIALRYAYNLGKILRFNLEGIHIPKIDSKEQLPGSGWVHQKWEQGIINQSKLQINRIIKEFIEDNPFSNLKVVIGEKEPLILDELYLNGYDLFIEGFLHSFEPERFLDKLDSELYQKATCPVLMVKNLMDLNLGLQIVGTTDEITLLLENSKRFIKQCSTDINILMCHFETSQDEIIHLENESSIISQIENYFLEIDVKPGKIQTVKGSYNSIAQLLRENAMIISMLPEISSKMAQLLSMSPCPTLFYPKPKTDSK
jgi:hypothetical protein